MHAHLLDCGISFLVWHQKKKNKSTCRIEFGLFFLIALTFPFTMFILTFNFHYLHVFMRSPFLPEIAGCYSVCRWMLGEINNPWEQSSANVCYKLMCRSFSFFIPSVEICLRCTHSQSFPAKLHFSCPLPIMIVGFRMHPLLVSSGCITKYHRWNHLNNKHFLTVLLAKSVRVTSELVSSDGCLPMRL